MKEPVEQKTDAEKSAEKLLNAEIDKDYKFINGTPIPYGRGVLVKKINQTSIEETEAGILLLQNETEKSRPLHIGIIHAVGPDCSKFMKVGTRCYFNFFVDSCFRFNGVELYKMEESDVFYHIPSSNTLLMEGTKEDKEVRRGKKIGKQQSALIAMNRDEQNERDRQLDKTKGKTHYIN